VPANAVQPAAGTKADAYLGLPSGEHVLAIVPLEDPDPIALGTAQGVVKRVSAAELPLGKTEVDIIGLKPGDSVVGAAVAPDDSELVFVTSDAQLLRFGADAVRPQGKAAGGMAGIRVADGERVIAFTAVRATDDTVVATVAGSSQALSGTDAGSGKVSAFAEFPAKGRGTGGVRAQRFLKGEDTLTIAWIGDDPRAVGPDGAARKLPESGAKRDASGQPLEAVIGAIGTTVG
jgi:DNA gyrase subunit A